MYIFIVLKTI